MRYLGLDVGEKRIGVAVGESLASELTTIIAAKNKGFYETASANEAYEKLEKIIQSEQTDAIVVGLPVNEEGGLTSEAQKIKKFGDGLTEALDCVVHYVNETLTTFMASEMLESQGLSVAEAKLRVDQLAAQLILQQFLEENVT